MFPSPIYGASFKQDVDDNTNMEFIMEFPSPIYGASFKLYSKKFFRRLLERFPSPIYGASFKPK